MTIPGIDSLAVFIIPTFIPIWIAMVVFQERFTKFIHDSHNEVWAQLGAPGGLFWRPKGRSWWSNFIVTSLFWGKNQFGLEQEASLPEEIVQRYRPYCLANVTLFTVGVLGGLLLMGLHVYSIGIGKSD